MRILSCLTVAILSVVSPICLAEQTTSTTSSELINEIKDESVGIGRFRSGWIMSAGYGKGGTDAPIAIEKEGFEASLGVHTSFTPIRNWLEFEAGVLGTFGLPADSADDNGKITTEYKYNLATVSAYAGPVFPIRNGKNAIAAGAFISLVNKPILTDDTQLAIIKGKFQNVEDQDIENHVGLYAELQFSGKDSSTSFVRANVGQYERSQANNASQKSTDDYVSLVFGYKTNGFGFK